MRENIFEQQIGERININNVGKIKNAEIKLNGLTVIAGENDTGKSTVGKLIFSTVKAISRYEQDFNESKINGIYKKIRKLYFGLRSTGVFYSQRNSFPDKEFENNDFGNFYPLIFLRDIKVFVRKDKSVVKDTFTKEQINNIFKLRYDILIDSKLSRKDKTKFINLLDNIKESVLKEEDKQEKAKNALNKAIFSEFYSEISPKITKKTSSVRYLSGNSDILNFVIENNQVISLNINDDLIFDDVIFIETPLLLQMYDLIMSSDSLFYSDIDLNIKPKVSLHIKDLITKIESAKYFSRNFFENNNEQIDILKKISSIMKGEYTFEQDNNDFVFSQKTKTQKNVKIRVANTASGIKSFGIIQLLIQANVLNDRSLLVIDEPENHLHPEWQIKYAEIITELVKNDIAVIISSHSPYIIQGLKHFSDKADIKEKTSFYLAELVKNENSSVILEVTNSIGKIFSKLSKPLTELVWM